MSECHVGIDVGGTFTDFVLTDARGVTTWKEPSSPADPAAAVIAGLSGLLERAEREPLHITRLVHGTTLALNAILQRRLAKVGLVVSEGFGDILVLGRGGLPNSFSYKDPKREPLVARRNVYEVPARLRPDSSVVASPTEADVARIADAIAADELEAVAVLVLNSYAHPQMETDLAKNLAERLPDVLVTASSALWPEVREFERALVTVLNAAIHPMMSTYYGTLQERLSALGFQGQLEIATSNGGTVGVATARARPIDTLLSGPAAGVAAAARLAAETGVDRTITVDMGGTSSDMSVARDGQPEFTTQTMIGDHPVIVPAVNVWAIGAGGGSILWVDPQGLLKVGPQSAGADPGPVAYGRGGTEATVTDCYLVLGFIDPDRFLGGRMPLDKVAARSALVALGERIGFTGDDAAERTAGAALRIATAKMASEIGKGMASRGLDPASFTLVPYGGAGPTHAALLAEAARIGAILIPPAPGTFCAFGTATGALRRDFARSRRVSLGSNAGAATTLLSTLRALEEDAQSWLKEELAAPDSVRLERFADMQYPRTATELTVAIPEDLAKGADAAALAELFHVEHTNRYGFRDAQSPVDVTTVRLVATLDAAPAGRHRTTEAIAGETTRRTLVWEGRPHDAEVHDAKVVNDGGTVSGPAVLEMEDSTVIVPPGWLARRGEAGALAMERKAHSIQEVAA